MGTTEWRWLNTSTGPDVLCPSNASCQVLFLKDANSAELQWVWFFQKNKKKIYYWRLFYFKKIIEIFIHFFSLIFFFRLLWFYFQRLNLIVYFMNEKENVVFSCFDFNISIIFFFICFRYVSLYLLFRRLTYIVYPSIISWLLVLLCCKFWKSYVCLNKDPSSQRPLPPGDLGLPFIGETLSFLFLVSTIFLNLYVWRPLVFALVVLT